MEGPLFVPSHFLPEDIHVLKKKKERKVSSGIVLSVQKMHLRDVSQAHSASLLLKLGSWCVSLKSTCNLLLF